MLLAEGVGCSELVGAGRGFLRGLPLGRLIGVPCSSSCGFRGRPGRRAPPRVDCVADVVELRALRALFFTPVISSIPLSLAPSLDASSSSASGRRSFFFCKRALDRGNLSRMLWQLSRRQDTSLSSCGVESARNRARLISGCIRCQMVN